MTTSIPPVSIPLRVAARAVDYLVLGAIGYALGLAVGFGFAWLVTLAPLVLAYFALGDALRGTTPGKALLGLRVVDPHGAPPTLRAGQGFHDRLAGGTRVVARAR